MRSFDRGYRPIVCLGMILLASGFACQALLAQGAAPAPSASVTNLDGAIRVVRSYNFQSLRLAITDLCETFGDQYQQWPPVSGTARAPGSFCLGAAGAGQG